MMPITLKCPECGASIQVEDGRDKCFCTYCGAQLYLDDGTAKIMYHEIKEQTNRFVDEAKVKEAELKLHKWKFMEERARQADSIKPGDIMKRGFIALVPLLLGLMVLMAGIQISNFNHARNHEIRVPISAEEMVGQDCTYIVKVLQDAGFQEITESEKQTDDPERDGQIISVSINGKTNFSSLNWFSSDAGVYIVYYSVSD